MSVNTPSGLAARGNARAHRKVWNTPGGIHPPEHKQQSLQLPLADLGIPPQLIYPLSQHVGAAAQPIVNVGDRVLTGQLIAGADDNISANIHAASSGTVIAIEDRPLPHPSSLNGTCIVIETDGLDQWTELQPCENYGELSPLELIEKIKAAGVIGMGGAGFPTAVKLSPSLKINTLIINGTECEPYITCDDLLMRTRAQEIIAGALLLSYVLDEPDEILIGIEDNKPEAIRIMREALSDNSTAINRVEIVELPTKYPSGGEKQLVQMLTGKEIPSGRIPAQIGMVCLNVASVLAAYRAVTLGEPLIKRITTITGDAFATQRNVVVRLGTPINFALEQHGYDATTAARLVMGGPMMGFTLLNPAAPIIKTTNCLLAPSLEEAPPPQPAQACIRCGMCAEACPASLLPQQLYWYARAQDHDKLKSLHLYDCIECGACAYVCPSHIPLVQYYRAAKGEIRRQEVEKIHSDRSRKRFEYHKERIEREKQERIRAREEAAEKAKARKAAKEKEQAKQEKIESAKPSKQQQEIKATPTAETDVTEDKNKPDITEQIDRVERSLLSNWDKLEKLNKELVQSEKVSPGKSNSIKAQIKGVELKCENLEKKLEELEQTKTFVNTSTSLKQSDSNPDQESEPEAKAEVQIERPQVPIEESPKVVTPAMQRLQDQLELTRQKLQEAIDEADEESVTAFNMSINILNEKLRIATEKAQRANNRQTISVREHEAVKSAIERAMERILNDREATNVEQLRRHMDKLQHLLQLAQQQLGSADETDPGNLVEISQAVQQLENKLTSTFEDIVNEPAGSELPKEK